MIGLSQTAIVRIWHAFVVQPHRVESFKSSFVPLFVKKVRDIAGLSLNPPERAVVVSVDEKSQVQRLDRTQSILPLAPWVPARQTHSYRRHQVTSLFAALDVASGVGVSHRYRPHRHQEFLRFLRLADESVPAELAIRFALNNYGTHKVPKVRGSLTRDPRFNTHITPTGASWLNPVERLFAELTERCARRGSYRAVRELEKAPLGYLDRHNQHPTAFVCVGSAELILGKVVRLSKRVSNSAY